jgi:pimeloyl-ACP methyl ester carboxylesterase
LILTGGCAQANPEDVTISPNDATATAPIISTETPSATIPPPSPVKLTDTPTATAIPATATPDVLVEEVTFTTQDGVNIAATLFGDGDLAIILLHMGKGKATGNDQEDWQPFARSLAEGGYSALTVDFRGRGESGGEFSNDPVTLDTQAALDFLHERGFDRPVCIGAGIGGTTCMHFAALDEFAGMVILSASLVVGPINYVSESELGQLTIPKLYLYGERDGHGFPDAMQKIYQVSAQPKGIISCDTAAHGSDLLISSCGEDIQQQIFSYLENLE